MRVRELVSTETAAGRLSRDLQTLADIDLKWTWMKTLACLIFGGHHCIISSVDMQNKQ